MIVVLGGEIDLYLDTETISSRVGNPIVCPRGYGLAFDTSGRQLSRRSLFLGPIETTRERVEVDSEFVRSYFGEDYEPLKARIDVPDNHWQPVGRVEELVYYRPGRYRDDWRHGFREPVRLLKQGAWYQLRSKTAFKITYRGIESP